MLQILLIYLDDIPPIGLVKFDKAPIYLFDIPLITTEALLDITIQTEWDAEFRHNGEVVELLPGNATIQINLDESQELNWTIHL